MDKSIETIVASLRDIYASVGGVLDNLGEAVHERVPQLDECRDCVFVNDRDGRIRYQNRTFTELFCHGCDRSGSFGADCLPHQLRELSTSTDSFVTSFGRSIRVECSVDCGSTEVLLETYKFPLLDKEHDQTNGIIGVARKIECDSMKDDAPGEHLRIDDGTAAFRQRLVQLDELINENNAKLCLLTNQQLKVVCLLALGRTNREVAAELGISRRTVEMHRQVARRRLRVNSFYDLLRIVAHSSFDVVSRMPFEQPPVN
ncbi:LuxR C-terminal-related transcriptional regulator [Planctomycetota bacterium]